MITLTELVTLTAIPCLCIGYMVFDTIVFFRLERKFDSLREDKRLMREELDSLRARLKKIEIESKEAEA